MTEDQLVVVDGASPERKKARQASPWLLTGLGFVVGLGLGVSVVGSSPEADTAPVPDTPLVGPSIAPNPGSPPRDQGISDVIEGFPDGLVAVAATNGSALDYLLWPKEGVLRATPMAPGQNVSFDSSARFIAFTNPVPGMGGQVLFVGRSNQMRSVASSVESVAWHDREAGLASFTTVDADGWNLWTIKGNFEPDLVALDVETEGDVAAWGDWGWALQRGTEVLLLTSSGEFKATATGTAIGSRPDGWIFVVGDDAKLVSAGGGVKELDGMPEVGSSPTAEFSPNGELVAVGGSRGVAVVNIESGEWVDLDLLNATTIAWSSDSRFLLAGSSNIVVVDLQTGETTSPMRQFSVLTFDVLPLSTP